MPDFLCQAALNGNPEMESMDKYPSCSPHFYMVPPRSPEGKRMVEWTEEETLKISTFSLLINFVCLLFLTF